MIDVIIALAHVFGGVYEVLPGHIVLAHDVLGQLAGCGEWVDPSTREVCVESALNWM